MAEKELATQVGRLNSVVVCDVGHPIFASRYSHEGEKF